MSAAIYIYIVIYTCNIPSISVAQSLHTHTHIWGSLGFFKTKKASISKRGVDLSILYELRTGLKMIT